MGDSCGKLGQLAVSQLNRLECATGEHPDDEWEREQQSPVQTQQTSSQLVQCYLASQQNTLFIDRPFVLALLFLLFEMADESLSSDGLVHYQIEQEACEPDQQKEKHTIDYSELDSGSGKHGSPSRRT